MVIDWEGASRNFWDSGEVLFLHFLTRFEGPGQKAGRLGGLDPLWLAWILGLQGQNRDQRPVTWVWYLCPRQMTLFWGRPGIWFMRAFWWQHGPFAGVHGKVGPSLQSPSHMEKRSLCTWAAWAWEKIDEGPVNLSLIPFSVHISLFMYSTHRL